MIKISILVAIFVAVCLIAAVEANLKINNCPKLKGAANITKLEISGLAVVLQAFQRHLRQGDDSF